MTTAPPPNDTRKIDATTRVAVPRLIRLSSAVERTRLCCRGRLPYTGLALLGEDEVIATPPCVSVSGLEATQKRNCGYTLPSPPCPICSAVLGLMDRNPPRRHLSAVASIHAR